MEISRNSSQEFYTKYGEFVSLTETIGDKLFWSIFNLYFFNLFKGMQVDFSESFFNSQVLNFENVFLVRDLSIMMLLPLGRPHINPLETMRLLPFGRPHINPLKIVGLLPLKRLHTNPLEIVGLFPLRRPHINPLEIMKLFPLGRPRTNPFRAIAFWKSSYQSLKNHRVVTLREISYQSLRDRGAIAHMRYQKSIKTLLFIRKHL